MFPTKVAGLKMDLKNFGTASLPIRIAIREGSSGSGTPGYASTTAFSLPNDGQWHKSVFFPLTASTMTADQQPKTFATDLASVLDFRLLSSISPSTIGDSFNARFGVDNITAVPEPGSARLAALAGLLLSLCLHRRWTRR